MLQFLKQCTLPKNTCNSIFQNQLFNLNLPYQLHQQRFKKLKRNKLPKRKPAKKGINFGHTKYKWETTVKKIRIPMPNDRLPRKPHLPHIYKANTPKPYFFWEEPYTTEQLMERIKNVEQQRRAGTSALCLSHLFYKIDDGDQLKRALECARSGYITRVRQRMYEWDTYVSKYLIKKSVELDRVEVGVEALERSWYFGFAPDLEQHEMIMSVGATNSNLGMVIRVYNAMKQNKVEPGAKVAQMLTGSLIEAGRAKIAREVLREFEANGFEVSEETKQKVESSL
eukprot:TRINITY_DN3354_c0_g1_i2.p2 TRINITY_DN3354_c0_g1~~TRINITY_DN3354_c0_g1_i2.p2  ORF type:complete len:283 (+),score=23.66 TRINITY_DN3354_c0_g1_i2:109-957(+)